ncbi:hypothetical protein [Azospirillum brasilense]|uniref:hypothetical protein n=1 Tax=Azospirillum brasilense TaxID=192 RepID=UPI0011C4AB02|nr:hypothetical protein [Azospirillum brasilense]NUB25760.1 hypothetical protein [Azospirillum brasilense]NUB33898.1 hypothetical protein [Azospirillum brasilense]
MAAPQQKWVWGELLARFVIPGEPAAKGNSREIVQFGDRAALRKGDKALAFESTAGLHVPKWEEPYDGDVAVSLRIYYASRRPDLDGSLVYDALQNRTTWIGKGEERKARVEKRLIVNDRQIRLKHEEGFVDPARPRVEVAVYKATLVLAGAA